MSATTRQVAAAVRQYSKEFYKATASGVNPTLGESNYIASPFGAWLLLVFIAASTPIEDEAVRSELEEIIGIPLDKASTFAQHAINEITAEESEAALCAWFQPEYAKSSERISQWLDKNTLGLSGHYIPEKAQLDAWTEDLTRGLIKKFPADIDGSELAILASIIYSKFKWRGGFEVVDAPDEFVEWDVEKVLTTTDDIVRFVSHNGSLFAVLSKAAAGHKSVTTVMSLTHNYDDAAAYLNDAEEVMAGEGHGVGLDEIEDIIDGAPEVKIEYVEGQASDTYEVWLPAWSAEATLNLNVNELGIGKAMRELGGNHGASVVQSAVAKYTAEGFEGAAITVAIMRGTAFKPVPAGAYSVSLMMNKPAVAFCVVAGVPLFSAVITTANEA